MNREIDAIQLLVLWHRISQAGALRPLGFPAECPSTRGYQASRQYDDQNGAMETDERGGIARMVQKVVDGIAEPHRTALYVLARNRATGSQVWASARIPGDKDEVLRITGEAVAMFCDMV